MPTSILAGIAQDATVTAGNTLLAAINAEFAALATAANQATGNTSLGTIATNTPTVGQKTMAGSAPVAIASDQGNVPVAVQGTVPVSVAATLPVSIAGTVATSASALPLPAGASTSALQTTGNTSLATIATNTPTVGQKASAGSAPVVLASDQSNVPVAVQGTVPVSVASTLPVSIAATVPVSAASLPLPTGAATSANQSTEITAIQALATALPLPAGAATSALQSSAITSLGTIATNTGAGATAANQATELGYLSTIASNVPVKGNTTMSASQPVTIASDQTAIPVVISDSNITGASAQTVIVNNILPVTSGANGTDASGFRSAAVQVNSTATGGTYIFEGSNDNTNWLSVPVYNATSLNGTAIVVAQTATVSSIMYLVPITFRYLRLRIVSTITGGSIQAISRFSDEAFASAVTQVAQNTAGNLNVTVANLPTVSASDGMGNPSTAQTIADAGNFNGSSWDRVRNNFNTSTGDTGAKTATFNGATQVNYNGRGCVITALLGTVTGTTPTMGMQLQWSPDAGTTWLNYGTAIAATQAVATGNTLTLGFYPAQWEDSSTATLAAFTVGATVSKLMNAPMPRTWRIVYTIGGTTPSITITGVYVNYIL